MVDRSLLERDSNLVDPPPLARFVMVAPSGCTRISPSFVIEIGYKYFSTMSIAGVGTATMILREDYEGGFWVEKLSPW